MRAKNLRTEIDLRRMNADYLHHLLRYLRDMFQTEALRDEKLPLDLCPNQDAYQILKEDWPTYLKLAQQTAQISASDSVVYESFDADHPIQFRPLTDAQAEQIRRQMNGFTVCFLGVNVVGDGWADAFDTAGQHRHPAN